MNKINRREAVKILLHERGDLLVVTGLGASAYDVASVGDHPLDFPLWGAMGGAAMLGMGLALAQPQHQVLVLTGDGEMLMGLGSLATIATQAPGNLHIVVLDNEAYGETGKQKTHTAAGLDLAAVAKACGFPQTSVVTELSELESQRTIIHIAKTLSFTVIKISAIEHPKTLPPRDGPFLTHRMRAALLGTQKAQQD